MFKKRHYPKREQVLKVIHRNPVLDGRYLFVRHYDKVTSRNIETFFAGAITGNGDPILTLHETADRQSDSVQASARRIDGYHTVTMVDLPENIVNLIVDYENTDDEETLKDLSNKIERYFATP